MPTVTVKMSPQQHARLEAAAAARRISKSEIIREAIEQLEPIGPSIAGSFAERAAHLIGSISGPRDLASRSKEMKGYGQPHPR